MDKEQELEVAAEVGGVMIKVAIGGVGLLAAGPAGALAAPLLSELVGLVIPSLRRSRVEKFIKELCSRISHLEEEQARTRLLQIEYIDLFEDGCVQASRALDEERIGQLATFLASSMTDENLKYAHDKRLLTLLGELNQVELILLQSYAERNRRGEEFQTKHAKVFQYDRLAGGAPDEDRMQAQIIASYRNRLITLGLVGRWGSSSGLYPTVLGSALLKKVGAEDLDAHAYGEAIGPLDAQASHDRLMGDLRAFSL